MVVGNKFTNRIAFESFEVRQVGPEQRNSGPHSVSVFMRASGLYTIRPGEIVDLIPLNR